MQSSRTCNLQRPREPAKTEIEADPDFTFFGRATEMPSIWFKKLDREVERA
jgi:hypothetical protein